MKILVFAGAGTSVELGVPAMAGLAQGFGDHCRQWSVQPDLVGSILERNMDVEYLIEVLDKLCGAAPSLEIVGERSEMLAPAEKIRAEVEWYVQHSAERVASYDARLMWGSALRATDLHEVTFVTTNYDRAIEIAANAVGVLIDDGFGEFAEGEAAPWVGFSAECARTKLVKLHGSTDWYAMGDSGEPVKLRHPMALYGRSQLRLPDGPELRSALILPSREKMLTNAPYPRLSQKFLNVADECELAVFVGSSLRDPHIAEAVRSTAERVPTFVVNPQADGKTGHARGISEFASEFLLSTLPNALAGDPGESLSTAAGSEAASRQGILGAVRTLLDFGNDASSRCAAIDQLDGMGATLDASHLNQLLSDDDVTVARYALSLVYGSSQATELVEIARNTKHANVSDQAYCDDLDLLEALLNN